MNINLIPCEDDQYFEVELVSYKKIMELIYGIENKRYNKITKRWQIQAEAQLLFLEKIKNMATINIVMHTCVTITLDIIDDNVAASFSRYSAEAVKVIQDIGGSKFDRKRKVWFLNTDKIGEIVEQLNKTPNIIVNDYIIWMFLHVFGRIC